MSHASTRTSAPRLLQPHEWAFTLLAIVVAAWPAAGARAADARGAAAGDAHAPKAAQQVEGKAASKPAAKPMAEPAAEVKPAAPKPGTMRDPMDALREKLAAKLGASKAPDPASPYMVRVVSKAESGAGDAAPAAKTRNHTANVVAALRAEKAAAPGAAQPPLHWSYEGEGGPESWGRLRPEFAKCGNGTRQSPIDIRGGIGLDLEPIRFDYRATGFNVVDNGHTVQVNVGAENFIETMGRRYELVQLHFHRPSEERINGRRFDMSVHLVHKDDEGRLAVVAVPLERGTPHPQVQTVWNNLPLEKGEELPARVTLDPNAMLPKERGYYTYMGSLTTPPCSEGVLWMVMQQPVTVSMEQIAIFARLYPMNARPVQSAAGRLIKQSN